MSRHRVRWRGYLSCHSALGEHAAAASGARNHPGCRYAELRLGGYRDQREL